MKLRVVRVESLALFRQLGRAMMAPLPMSKLARTAFKRGHLDVAMQHVTEIVAHVDEGHPLDRSVASVIYFECFTVMAAAGHSRAHEFLALAYDEVVRQGQQLEPTERATFLKDVATNAAIVEAAAQDASPADRMGVDGPSKQ